MAEPHPPLSEILAEAREIGERLGLPPDILSNIESPNDFAAPYVVDDGEYHYTVRERGRDIIRKSTKSTKELLYWIFIDMTFDAAKKYELEHRKDGQDFRRILFAKQLELLGAIDPAWRQRCLEGLNAFLLQTPFTDSGPRTLS